MRLRQLAVLTIALSAMGCSTFSSLVDSSPPPDLQAAEARADRAVDCPQPPPELLQCLGGSQPWTEPVPGAVGALAYRCPIPPDLAAAIRGGEPMDVVNAVAIGDIKKEADLRFQSQHWEDTHCRASLQPVKPPAK